MGHSADSSELIPQIQTVRMSLRPPSRFTGGTNLILWLKRFEMYVRKVKIDESQWTSELLPLLDDGPFRVVSQQGLVDSGDYAAVTRCLRAQYAPAGKVPKTRSEGRRELGDVRWRTACVGRQSIPWMVKRPTATIGKGPVCARFSLIHCAAETHET